jgi:2-amino-4-hydroxy-6-hydroxymethyldihydropteridine diphosphokinase
MVFNLQLKMASNHVFISTGTNQGNRLTNLQKAKEQCEHFFGEAKLSSSIYETAAWGITNQNAFLNQVLLFDTAFNPNEILDILLQIEKGMGRIRDVKWGPRKIDLDILFIDEKIIDTSGLKVPHPQIPNRKFILIPMVEIAADFIHPTLHKSMAILLQDCEDELDVRKFNL